MLYVDVRTTGVCWTDNSEKMGLDRRRQTKKKEKLGKIVFSPESSHEWKKTKEGANQGSEIK